MLFHVPSRNERPLTQMALKRFRAIVFSHMNIKVGFCVIFFIAALEWTMEIILVPVCLVMFVTNPSQSKLLFAPWKRADNLRKIVQTVGRHMIIQSLLYLKPL